MSLELNQIRARIKNPKYKQEINNAIQHESKLKLHAETMTENPFWYSAFGEFVNWVENILPGDKFKMFLHLVRFPLQTNSVTADIFNEFEHIFTAKNAIFKWEFTSREYAEDFEHFRTKILKEQEIWRNEGFQALKTQINSVVVVDMHSKVKRSPEPYIYFVDIQHIVDVEFGDRPNELEFVIFKTDTPDPEKPRFACYDDGFYRILELDGTEYNIIIENTHTLGYCPAQFFYSKKMHTDDPVIRESEISKSLEDLNWYLFYATSKKYLDLYAPYPIYSAYRQDCDYKDDDGHTCDGGILRNENGQYVLQGNAIRKCPVCSTKNILGVGSFIEIDAPESADDADLRDPIQRLDAPIQSLKYNTEEVERLKKEIFFTCAGEVKESSNDQAKNELQIKSQYESRKNILLRVKKNFDIIHKFATDTVCRLRYGSDFIGSTINYGTDYFLKSADEYYSVYKIAKEAGASDTELDVIADTRISVQYRDNAAKLDRINLLMDIEPFQHRTTTELTELMRIDPKLINKQAITVKINFTNFIARFEAENGNILEFGSLLPYSEKLTTIKKTLKTYANEYL